MAYKISACPSDSEFATYFKVQQFLEEEAVDQYVVANVRNDKLLDQDTFNRIVSAFQKRKAWSANEYDDIVESYCSVTQDFSVTGR